MFLQNSFYINNAEIYSSSIKCDCIESCYISLIAIHHDYGIANDKSTNIIVYEN